MHFSQSASLGLRAQLRKLHFDYRYRPQETLL
jgi:hypothetical protein